MARLTLAAIRESVKLMVASSPQITDGDLAAIIRHSHRSLASTYQWSYRKRETRLATVAPLTAGTVAVVQGSATVTGTGTSWSGAVVGRQIRVANEPSWFWISATGQGVQTLTLADGTGALAPWVGASASGLAHTIFRDQYPVPADVGVILSQVRDWPLTETSMREIDAYDPERTMTGEPDRWYWARVTLAAGVETRYVGLWPVPQSAMAYRLPYLIEPPEMSAELDLPVCPSEALELLAGARACAFLHARTGDQRWANQMGALFQALMGTPTMLGVLQQCLHDDEHRFGLATRLHGTRAQLGADEWASRDWEAVL